MVVQKMGQYRSYLKDVQNEVEGDQGRFWKLYKRKMPSYGFPMQKIGISQKKTDLDSKQTRANPGAAL